MPSTSLFQTVEPASSVPVTWQTTETSVPGSADPTASAELLGARREFSVAALVTG